MAIQQTDAIGSIKSLSMSNGGLISKKVGSYEKCKCKKGFAQ